MQDSTYVLQFLLLFCSYQSNVQIPNSILQQKFGRELGGGDWQQLHQIILYLKQSAKHIQCEAMKLEKVIVKELIPPY